MTDPVEEALGDAVAETPPTSPALAIDVKKKRLTAER
tara:strand:+ start:9377 stop:9487 length:111 start_codon:yes stop_codon:yes gene_type:complete